MIKLEDFEKHRPSLLHMALSCTKTYTGNSYNYNHALAEDIVQDAFLKFHDLLTKGKVEFESEEHLGAILRKKVWQLSMTSRLNNKGVTYRAKEIMYDLKALADTVFPCLNPEIETKFRLKDIYTHIHSLKYKNDVNVLLDCIEGYTIKEIAVKHDKTVKAVVSSLYRARSELRTRLNVNKYFCTANR